MKYYRRGYAQNKWSFIFPNKKFTIFPEQLDGDKIIEHQHWVARQVICVRVL